MKVQHNLFKNILSMLSTDDQFIKSDMDIYISRDIFHLIRSFQGEKYGRGKERAFVTCNAK